ncbi:MULTISPECIES: nucleoid-associated protein [unclassified Bradyrhizobium]|uniref:nucleoid-associated protein n=1 Tax=unclassified Bradyrhizobium TaxID=2631580 RepID=UPI002916ED3F|nr:MULTISPECIES: nucleoid-associated protein [unclassified Bradyrhizobium]
MAFLTEQELESLRIDQSVFHIVGPGDEHFQLLAAFEAGRHAPFFLGRVRSVNSGNRYEFLEDAPVRAQLARISRDRGTFQEESEKLATAFNQAHGGSTAVGAFLIFSLSCSSGRIFALLKFEDEKVLSYDYDVTRGRSGKPRPTFGEIERTFVQNRNALQKAALIKLRKEGDEICVVDRQNPQRPAAYFEQFLLVRRRRTEEELTKAIVEVTRNIAYKHKEMLPQDTMKNLAQRLYEASLSGGSVDGENAENWLKSILGPLPDDSPIVKDFKAKLKREGMAGESFVLQKDAIPAPRNRRVETASGVKLTFPAGLTSSVVSVSRLCGALRAEGPR